MATRIYTKTGDDGTTALFGGVRVAKQHARIESYGTVDELNAVMGIALSCSMDSGLRSELESISHLLFTLGSDLATPLDPPPSFAIPRVAWEHTSMLERLIDAHEEVLQPLKNFILPGGTDVAAHLHHARTICRRAERHVSTLSTTENIGDAVLPFLNRLSDYLFVVARRANHNANVPDIIWQQ